MAFIPCGLAGISLLAAHSAWLPEAQAGQTAPLPLPRSRQAITAAGPLVSLSATSRRRGQTARVFHPRNAERCKATHIRRGAN